MPVWFASFADKVLVLLHLLWLQTNAVQVEPELAAVTLHPMDLKK